MGLRHAELILAVQAAYDGYQASGEGKPYALALRTLDAYRNSVDHHYIGNLAHLTTREWLWDRDATAKLPDEAPPQTH